MRLDNAARGLAGDAGEVSTAVMRFVEYGRPLDATNVLEEAGDCLWRIVQLLAAARALTGDPRLTLAGAMAANVRKLAVRYPDRYSDERSAGRNPAAELAAMDDLELGERFLKAGEDGRRRSPGTVQDGHGFGHVEYGGEGGPAGG